MWVFAGKDIEMIKKVYLVYAPFKIAKDFKEFMEYLTI